MSLLGWLLLLKLLIDLAIFAFFGVTFFAKEEKAKEEKEK